MRFEPSQGVLELEEHLEQLRARAAEQGHRFDRHAARNALHAAAFHLEQPTVVRVLLSTSGHLVLEMTPANRCGD